MPQSSTTPRRLRWPGSGLGPPRAGAPQDLELGSAEWRARFAMHLAAYGHLVYDLDFAHPVPADEPGPLLDTARFFLRGEGSDPYARQAGLAERRRVVPPQVLPADGLLARLMGDRAGASAGRPGRGAPGR